MTKTVLVLGATGFIGGHIARAAVEQGWEVRGLRRQPGALGHLGPAPVRWYEGDLEQPASLLPALAGVELLFHAAAYYPQGSRPVPEHVAHSVQQTRGVLEAAASARVGRVIFTSSLSTIGQPPTGADRLADERDHYVPGSLPGSAYYECKYAMESEALRACAAGQDVVVTNPTLVLDRPTCKKLSAGS
jgi:dihydroflavonol-4-reductase